MNWGRNLVWNYDTDYIQATFDGSGHGDHTYYECIAALNDSGGGFFIYEAIRNRMPALISRKDMK